MHQKFYEYMDSMRFSERSGVKAFFWAKAIKFIIPPLGHYEPV
jgi:hypothetical protein